MAFLKVNPRYQQFLKRHGLLAPSRFLGMPAVIISGHPDRNVARVTLGTGADTICALLKREHRVPWKERLLNAAAGFGFVSKSAREAAVLHNLRQAGIGCPDWIAVGADNEGRAFLVLRELMDAEELRLFLQDLRHAPPDRRRRFACRLGAALARLHNAGFDHPDLYSKHVLVNVENQAISFLDWQRSRRRRRVAWRRRCRDLAALQATLADDLTTGQERLLCLGAYLRNSRLPCGKKSIRSAAVSIRRLASRLLRQRRIRELCKMPAEDAGQRLIWQDGEALCLTPNFHADLAGQIPDWLRLAEFPPRPGSWQKQTWVDVSEHRKAFLVRRRESRVFTGLWALLRRRSPISREVRRAGLLFRLERYGIRAPRLLAFGQRHMSWQRVDSFILAEPASGGVSLIEWLARGSGEPGVRRRLIREAGSMLRRLHDLHCYLGGQGSFAVAQPELRTKTSLFLASVDAFQSRRRPSSKEAFKDLAALHGELSSVAGSGTDELRFLLSYLGLPKLGAAGKRLSRALRRCQTSTAILRIFSRFMSAGRFGLHIAEEGALP